MFIAVTCKHKQSQTCGQHVVMVSHVQRADCHVGSTYRLEGLWSYLGWTLIHFFAQIGTPRGCELYIDPDTLLQRGVGSHMVARRC
jgi:hypothetical protein